MFPVPLDDVGGATLNCEEKAITFMRWIRKALEARQFVKTVTQLKLDQTDQMGLFDYGNKEVNS